MIYKEFGNTGKMVSALGFGGMRFPMRDIGEKKIVDYDKAVPLLQRAFALGVNYVDSAPYYCHSDSEVAIGKALKGWRDKVYVSTKNPIKNDSADDFRARLEHSLTQLDTDYIDFYHLWGISLESFRTKIDVPNGPISAAMKALDEGLIHHLSFSFHDKPENMIPIIDSGYFSSVLCQYNLLDRENEASIAYAKSKGLGTVIMGPVGGGRLGMPSEKIRKMLGRELASTAEMALRFVLANPHVNTALSGMETIEMLEENAKVASIEGPLTADELNRVDAMLTENARLAELYCTGCKYCLPCPQGINIPLVFSYMNIHRVYGITDHARSEYAPLCKPMDERTENWQKELGVDASHCIECGQCESKCPQHLQIIQQLKETHAAIGQ